MEILSIIGIVIGIVTGIYGFWTMIKQIIEWAKKRNAKREARTQEYSIIKEWNAYYEEDDRQIQQESIDISIDGKNIIATIMLKLKRNDKRKYTFTGNYEKLVLSGSYNENQKKGDRKECGTLSLTYVNDGLMFGYCCLVDEKRNIYNSPYVLTPKRGISENTYDFCKGCHQQQFCCCNHASIDMPILLPNEVEAIAFIKKEDKSKFAIQQGNLWQMKRKDNACYFYQNNRCTIYKERPIDCRFFPFDIYKDNGKNMLVLYKKNICEYVPDNNDEIEKFGNKNKRLIKLIYPYLNEWSDEKFIQLLKMEERDIINSVEDVLNN
jgi:Fe-S-cluster containining protein